VLGNVLLTLLWGRAASNVHLFGAFRMKSRCFQRSGIAALLLLLVCTRAQADFVNNVENFNGTSVDLNTWEPSSFGDGAATVSNGNIDFSGQYYLATRSITIGIGTPVVARVMLTASSSFGTSVDLGLTANPANPFSSPSIDVKLLNTIQGESDLIDFNGTNGSGIGGGVIPNDVGNWYRIVFLRTTSTNFTTSLFTDSGSLVTSFNSTYSGLPNQATLYIGGGPTAQFDSVAIPEPCTGLLACGTIFLLTSLRTGRRGSRT
jgi:hypothetical protein